MALDFPSSPSDGQIYDNYYYDATTGVWNSLGNYAIPNLLSNATFTSSGASNVPLTVKGHPSQAANLQEWKNSSGTTLASMSASGGLTLNNALTVANGGTGATTASAALSNLGGAALSGADFTGSISSTGVIVSTAGPAGIVLKAGSTTDHAYMTFHADSQAQSTRSAWFGFGSPGGTEMGIVNEMTNGNLTISVNGTGQVNLPSKTYLPGAIVQAKQAQTNSVLYQTSYEIANIAGLEISFTPKFSNSKILLTAAINSDIRYVATFGFRKDGNVVSTTNNNNSSGSVATVYYGTDTNAHIMNTYIEYAESAGSTTARTYTAAACASWAGGLQTLTINDRGSSLDMRSVSSMTVYEIAQ